MSRRITLMLALAVAAGVAQSAEGQLQNAQRCAQIADSLQRLVCYDRVFAPPAATPVAPVAVAPVAPPAPVAVAPVMPPPAAVPVPVAAPVAVAPVAPVAAAVAGTEQFGADALKRPIAEREAEAVPRSMSAAVTELRETRPKVFRITLDNGQVWQQMDVDSQFFIRVGDTVEINRGRLGGYRLARSSGGGGAWVRVDRVK